MQYAETISLDGGEVAVILLILFALLAFWVAVVVFGCLAATRAGRGSRPDAVTWAALAIVQLVPGILGGPNILLTGGLIALVLQAGLYLRGRGTR